MRGNPDLSEGDSSSSRSGHDSDGPNRPSRAQIQGGGGHDPESKHDGGQPFTPDRVMTRCGLACQVIPRRMARTSRPTIAATDRCCPAAAPVICRVLTRLRGHTAPALGGPGRDSRPGPIAGSDNGFGHRGGGVRDVPLAAG